METLANTILYEGYRLFPYGPTAIKNTRPSLFGVVYPEKYSMQDKDTSWYMQTEILLQGSQTCTFDISLRFLQLKEMTFSLLGDLTDDKKKYFHNIGKNTFSIYGHHERKVYIDNLYPSEMANEKLFAIEFKEESKSETLSNAEGKQIAESISKLSYLKGSISVLASSIEKRKDLFKITVRVNNTTPLYKNNDYHVDRDLVLRQSFLSTHLILRVQAGRFISLVETDSNFKEAIKQCKNINMWPVLARREDDIILSSPIILYDYPEIAPESTGDLFDSTEIEEYLLLHIALLSEEEREKFSLGDEKLRTLFENIKRIGPEQMLRLHGTLRFTRTYNQKDTNADGTDMKRGEQI